MKFRIFLITMALTTLSAISGVVIVWATSTLVPQATMAALGTAFLTLLVIILEAGAMVFITNKL
jgi:hypothetical protein